MRIRDLPSVFTLIYFFEHILPFGSISTHSQRVDYHVIVVHVHGHGHKHKHTHTTTVIHRKYINFYICCPMFLFIYSICVLVVRLGVLTNSSHFALLMFSFVSIIYCINTISTRFGAEHFPVSLY